MPKIIDYLTYKDKFYLSFAFVFFLVKYVKESKIFNNFVFKLNSIQIMKKLFFGALCVSVLLTSCISSKKYADLETQHNKTKQDLVDAKADLQSCLVDKDHLMELNNSLKEDKARSIQQVDNLTVLTQSSSDNIKEVIAQLSEKDKYINGVRDAMTKKDSINLALAFQLKKDLAAGIRERNPSSGDRGHGAYKTPRPRYAHTPPSDRRRPRYGSDRCSPSSRPNRRATPWLSSDQPFACEAAASGVVRS